MLETVNKCILYYMNCMNLPLSLSLFLSSGRQIGKQHCHCVQIIHSHRVREWKIGNITNWKTMNQCACDHLKPSHVPYISLNSHSTSFHHNILLRKLISNQLYKIVFDVAATLSLFHFFSLSLSHSLLLFFNLYSQFNFNSI